MTQRIFAFIRYIVIFLREMLLANVTVVKQVLSPKLKIRPGFISVPMSVRGDFEVTTYANSMTLTPGTISVHIPDDRHAIVLHAMDIGDDPDAIRRSCTEMLEKNILLWSRDASNRPPAGGLKPSGDLKDMASDSAVSSSASSPVVTPKPSTDDLHSGESI